MTNLTIKADRFYEPGPNFSPLPPARKTPANALGHKANRPDHRVVNARLFSAIVDLDALLDKLLGADARPEGSGG